MAPRRGFGWMEAEASSLPSSYRAEGQEEMLLLPAQTDGGVRLCCPQAGQVTLKGQRGSDCTFHLPPVLPFCHRISASPCPHMLGSSLLSLSWEQCRGRYPKSSSP